MIPRINMIGIITNDFDTMHTFYRDVLGFEEKLVMESFVEFVSEGVRLAISTGSVMEQATGDASYTTPHTGHAFELAFDAGTPADVDVEYRELVERGALPVKEPADMPWGQRTAFFADPDGNIHEIFANL